MWPQAVEIFHPGQMLGSSTIMAVKIKAVKIKGPKLKPSVTHSSFLHTLRHHDHVVDTVLPHHPPEIIFGARQRALGGDVLSAVVITLNTHTHTGERDQYCVFKCVCLQVMYKCVDIQVCSWR